MNNDKLEWLNGEGPSGQPAVAVLHALKELLDLRMLGLCFGHFLHVASLAGHLRTASSL